MTLTAAPVPGNTILSSWGTEIRNRTMQVFASFAEMDAWAAPGGSFAITADTRKVYERISGAWRLFGTPTWTGASQVATFSNGQANFPHSLGMLPTWAIIQPKFPSTWAFHYVQGMSTTGVTVLCHDVLHTPLNQVTVDAYVQVGL